MQEYIAENTNSSKINNLIIDFAKKTDELVLWAKQICQGENDRQLFIKHN
jgi:hypothetical protein